MKVSETVEGNRANSTVANVQQGEEKKPDSSVKIDGVVVVQKEGKEVSENRGTENEIKNDAKMSMSTNVEVSAEAAAASGDPVDKVEGKSTGEPILFCIAEEKGQKHLTGRGRFRQFVSRTKGIMAALLCSLQLAICTYLASWFIQRRDYDPSHCLIVRFIGITVFSLVILAYAQWKQRKPLMCATCPSPFKKTLAKNFGKIMARSIFGSAAIIFQFYAVSYISSADATVIMYINPIFVGLGACICLKEKCGIIPSIMAILAIVGGIIAVNPPFIAGAEKFTTSKLLGIGLAVMAMLLTAMTMIIIRLLKYIHFSLLTAAFGLVGLLAAIVMAASTKKLSRSMDKVKAKDGPSEVTVIDVFLFITLAVLSALGLIFNTLALYWEQAGAVAMVKSSEIIFALLLQLTMPETPTAASYGGAVIVIFCISVIGFRQYLLSMRDGHKCKKKLWFILK